MSSKPWDIYANQLLSVGHGLPLWVPEPDSRSGREVFIGDVGWLKDGKFHPLFNSMNGADHPTNQETNVPRDFEDFCPPTHSISKSNQIMQPVVHSRSIKETQIGCSLLPESVGLGWRFQTKSETGALLALETPGVGERISAKRRIFEYMRDNFDSWLEFANALTSWGLGLRPEDIIFVCGTVKTTKWSVAAFQGSVFRDKDGYVLGENVGFSVYISNQSLPTAYHRTGPRRPTTQVSEHHRLQYPGDDTSSGISTHEPDQCLFIHYYKMKRRIWWKEPIQARAGPHQLPPRGADNLGPDAISVGGGLSPYEVEPEPHARHDAYDPVNHLLNYILQTSEVDTAIASDLDLTALFRDMTFPDDIPAALMELSPSVEVDDHGVGTVCVDHGAAHTSDRDRDEEACRYHEDVPQNPPVASYSPDPPQASSGMQSTPQDFALPPHGAARSPASPPQGKINVLRHRDDVGERTAKPGEKVMGKRQDCDPPRGVHGGSVTALSCSANGKDGTEVSEGTAACIWDVRNDMVQQNVPLQGDAGYGDPVFRRAFSRDNVYLASTSHHQARPVPLSVDV